MQREAGAQGTHFSVLGAGFGHELTDMMLSFLLLSIVTSYFLRKKYPESNKLSSWRENMR